MVSLADLALVFVAGLITALATGLGAIPFFFVKDVSDRWNVALWGIASGIMVAASVFGLLNEGLSVADNPLLELGGGMLIGVLLVVVAHHYIDEAELDAGTYEEADFKKLTLILGILTVHSFPEGVAVGVSFGELGAANGFHVFGYLVPLLAVYITVAISIHNIPEGLAISIPLRSMEVSNWRMVWWAVFSSLPQPVGAVIAFYFVRIARQFLPLGFGFAAGAMIYLVLTEFVPEAYETGAGLPRHGVPELVGGVLAGVLVMVPLAM